MLWLRLYGFLSLAGLSLGRGGYRHKTTTTTTPTTSYCKETPSPSTSTSRSISAPWCTRCTCAAVTVTVTGTTSLPEVTFPPVFATSLGFGGEIIPETFTETYTSIAWSTIVTPDLSPPAEPPDHVDVSATDDNTDDASSDSDPAPQKRQPTAPNLPALKRQLPSSITWRSRWGWSFLSSPQSQGGCQSCWAFAATALLETQARIEHGAWSKRSEADLHDMLGASCGTTGGPGGALDWAREHKDGGVADVACYPYTGTDQVYYPCGDREGRTVRMPAYTKVGGRDQQKRWLVNVGPLAACFNVYQDFYGFNWSSGTAYSWNGRGSAVGGHCILIVGYDDNVGGWIFRNSWGAGWGDGGYGIMQYGTASIDAGSKLGISNVNPDPWSKKRHRNGILLESGNGVSHRNFEVLRSNASGGLTHVWREGEGRRQWHTAGPVVQLDGKGKPVDNQQPFGQPVLLGTSFNRDFEVIYVNTDGDIVGWHYAQSRDRWYRHANGHFSGFQLQGYPGFVQMDDASFSLVVRTSTGALQEWTRSSLTGHWTLGPSVSPPSTIRASGPALVSSNVGLNIYDRARSSGGNLYVVAVLTTGRMQLFYRPAAGEIRPCPALNTTWIPTEIFGSGITNMTPPVMIQDYWRTEDERQAGGFQLLVAVSGRVQHWQRVNTDIDIWPPVAGVGAPKWGRVRTFGSGEIKHVWGLLQGSWRGALDAVVEDWQGRMWHWRFSGNPGQWARVAQVPGVRGG